MISTRVFRFLGACLALIGLIWASAASAAALDTKIVEYPLKISSHEPNGVAMPSDGNIWFTEQGANNVGRITPSGDITEFGDGISSGAVLGGMVEGADGNLWFTELNRGQIGRITLQGQVTEFGPVSSPYVIAPGADGNLWFTDNGSNQIGRITPTGDITEFPVKSDNASVYGIAAGPDGNLWFAEQFAHKIGKITLNGEVTEYSDGLTFGGEPLNIAAGPDGNLWFTEGAGNRIGRITTAGVITEFSTGISPNSHPQSIAAGIDGNLWFTELDGNRIGKITPDGIVTEYTIPTNNSRPSDLRADASGNIWFTEYDGNKIGMLNAGTGGLQQARQVIPANKTPLKLSRPVLFWAPGRTAKKYTIILKQDSIHNPVFAKIADIKNLLQQTPTLPGMHTYYWQVQACRKDKCVASEWRSFRTK